MESCSILFIKKENVDLPLGPQTNEDSTKMLSSLALASPTPSAVFPFSNGQVDYESKSRIRF